ncbi:Down syndrome cell adhesion molecule-like protein Dscam2 [Melipona quadrifasciata]|uniref:Down syndrome cell adhesion molecule-like protein Dscam2 n=1 Tax=Melipona quadrifasciata TaxID=166423 RepID=A0A0M8ZVZ1_9HYME|nr:Down syndrome cell adhesion molecule-like protein Dscam2 [Melipona quadrifasciata]
MYEAYGKTGNRCLVAVVGQRYAVNVMDEHVLRGNAAIIKCHIPSFVAEFVEVDSWIEDEKTEIYPSTDYVAPVAESTPARNNLCAFRSRVDFDDTRTDGKYLVLPSGELHIRDVGPEDGYKTYQCRTKHRLTGETRLSATKGRLVITEPVGSVRPKFPTIDDTRGFRTMKDGSVTLLCSAQGFPVPVHKKQFFNDLACFFIYNTLFTNEATKTIEPGFEMILHPPGRELNSPAFERKSSLFLEPVGFAKPKFSTIDKSRAFEVPEVEGTTLQCPAQAYPVPVFKTSRFRKAKVLDDRQEPNGRDFGSSGRYIAVSYSGVSCPSFQHGLVSLCDSVEPVGSKAPAFTGSLKGGWMEAKGDISVVLFCPAQGYPVSSFSDKKTSFLLSVNSKAILMQIFPNPVTEPVATKKPKFSSDAKKSWYDRVISQDLTLFCPAQGFPVPSYSKAPAFTGVLKGGYMADTDVVLFCPAQGYPVPSFRTDRDEGAGVYERVKGWLAEEESEVQRRPVVPGSGTSQPVGSKAPALTGDLKGGWKEKAHDSTVVLFCPAQGYPVPSFRGAPVRTSSSSVKGRVTRFHRSEPRGSVRPNVRDKDVNGLKRDILVDRMVGLPCPVQGYPAPTFRYYRAGHEQDSPAFLGQEVRKGGGTGCQGSGYRVEPLAAGIPRTPDKVDDDRSSSRDFSTVLLSLSEIVVVVDESMSQLMSVHQGETRCYPVEELVRKEPSGRTAPKGTGDGLNKYRGVEGESLALACAAQGFPAPISRARILFSKRSILTLYPVSGGGTAAKEQRKTREIGRSAEAERDDKIGEKVERQGERRAEVKERKKRTKSREKRRERKNCTTCTPCQLGTPVAQPHEIDDGSATLRKGCGPSSPSVTSVLIRVGPRGCHPINGANNVALHLHTSNKSHDIWLARVEDSGKYLCIVNNSVGGESVETVLTVTAPLAAEIEPSTQTIDFGRPATFTCNVRGNPIKTVSWLKDGKPLGLEEPVLRIESVKKEDKGMYQCFVRNDQESAQATAELKLGGRFEPPQIRQAFAEETLQPGPSMFLKCVASGNPTPEITWELDGKRLSNTERLQVGQYVTVNGDVVGSAEHSARLNVYGLPFIRHMDKKAIVAGETLRVTCPVAGYPIESIVWERDTRVLPINRKQKVFPNGTLIIENVERMSDQATYTCVARNAQGYSARGTLEVQVMANPADLSTWRRQRLDYDVQPSNSAEKSRVARTVHIAVKAAGEKWKESRAESREF